MSEDCIVLSEEMREVLENLTSWDNRIKSTKRIRAPLQMRAAREIKQG